MSHIRYHSAEDIHKLDLNTSTPTLEQAAAGATGRNMYCHPVRVESSELAYPGRDFEKRYIYNVERNNHPANASRFGYGRCEFGYCSGHWPGKYIVSDECACCDLNPKFMAPARFYL